MSNLVYAVQQRAVPNGMEVIGFAHSDRGTKYISNSIVVLRAGKSEKEYKEAIELAVKKIYKPPGDLGNASTSEPGIGG